MLKFCFLIRPGIEQEIFIQDSSVENILASVPHEAAHAEIARYFGWKVFGIAMVLGSGQQLIIMTIYETTQGTPVEDACIVFAAGGAGEKLRFGTYNEGRVSRDKQQIADFGCTLPFDVLVQRAESILKGSGRPNFERISDLLQHRIFKTNNELKMGPLPNGCIGAYILRECDISPN